uniref:HP domain-containing protein n=1 Tax=Solanum lycopersicum TaxID=4081 RepID=A0A3Q7JFB7_SOLLC
MFIISTFKHSCENFNLRFELIMLIMACWDFLYFNLTLSRGTEIWRIEDFQPVPLPKSECGKFYSGDSYIILQTTSGKGGSYIYDIHFWLGKNTSQDEAGTAAIKTVELDAIIGGRAVQHREIQGHESDKFLSYFKPCLIPLEGGVASGFKKPEEEEFETRLYVCKGKRVVRMKQVPFSRSSLNHDDVFILDSKDKIYQFNGANSNIQERAKALEVIQFLKDKYHEGTCDVAIVDDGNLQAETDSGSFWVLFGGFAPIGKKVTSEDDIVPEKTPAKLYSITDGQVSPVDGEFSKSSLENNKCFLLDCGAEVFVWVGRVTQLEERKAATQAAEEFLSSQNRPKSTHVTRLIQGYETYSFKSNFDSWPSGSAPAAEEGRGKVAALLKQQGIGVKGASKSAPVNEEVPPLLEGGGKIEVWRINGSAKTSVTGDDIGKFHCGDCYIILYTYHHSDRKEDYYLCWWIGKDSVEEDQNMAAKLASTMCNSLKGRPVLGRIYQGKEPPQFVANFQPMLVLKGGLSSGYKNYVADKGLNDETYTADSVALIRVSGTSVHNNKAVQVDAVAASLNSNECFLLQSGSSVFSWHGNQSTYEQQQLTAKLAEFLKIEEIYNFCQDDLLTEDVLLLDTHAEVFVWVGQSSDPKEKQSSFEIGQAHGNSFQKKVMLLFGVGHASEKQPRSNGTNNGGSTQRASALAALNSAFNSPSPAKSGSSPRSGRSPGSQRAAAIAALSSVLSAEKKQSPEGSSPLRLSRTSSVDPIPLGNGVSTTEVLGSKEVPEFKETEKVEHAEADGEDIGPKPEPEQEETDTDGSQTTYSYERLKAKSKNPVTRIDFKRREAYLSDEEFQSILKMTKESFYKLPKWKQDIHKKKVDLF